MRDVKHLCSSRLFWLVLLIVVLVIAGVAALLVRHQDPDRIRTGGPIGSREGYEYGVPAPFGPVVATGTQNMYNYGPETAVLERIIPIDVAGGIAVKAVSVAGRKRGAVPGIQRWPSDDFRDLAPIKGYRLAPFTERAGEYGAGVVFTLKPERPGRYVVGGFDVVYRVSGKRYRSTIRNPFALCSNTGRRNRWKTCELPPVPRREPLDKTINESHEAQREASSL